MSRRISEERAVSTDVHLQRDVMDEISWDPSIDASQIGVTATDGVVTLTGHVPVYAEKHAAEEATKRVHGVKAVANEIEVRPSDSHRRDDEDIAAAAIHALDWHSKVPHEHVQVIVDQGHITLEGTVDWQYQKAAVERVVRHLTGTRGVTNNLIVKPSETNNEVKAGVKSALLRSATLRSRKVEVEITESGLVTLTGDVHSLGERDEAERMVWAARGVHRVENCITVTPWGDGPADEWGY